MAADPGTAGHPVNWLGVLEQFAEEFDFHVAMRRLECAFRDMPRFGEAMRPSDEPIRVGQDPSTAFAPSALTSFRPPGDGRPGRLAVAFFGMFGPRGALPVHITEYARDRLRNAGDRTLASFVDLFHHRMFLLFHRAWAAAQPTSCQDRPKSNRFSIYAGALFGLALPSMLGRDAIPDQAKLQYAGRLSALTRNAEGLRAVVADFFRTQVAIESFVGEWLTLPDDGRWSLGESRAASTLGRSTVLGRRVFQTSHKFRVVLGPLSRETFGQMLPGGRSLKSLAAMVRTYVGDEFKWDVRLVLDPNATDQLQLSGGGRLGWNTRLGSTLKNTQGEDLIVDPSFQQTKRTLSRAPA
jgi:type VI secretion system protein ImpH